MIEQHETDKIPTPAEAVQTQMLCIQRAIELLQDDLDELTSTIDPETAKWIDTATFSHASGLAQGIIAVYAERSAKL